MIRGRVTEIDSLQALEDRLQSGRMDAVDNYATVAIVVKQYVMSRLQEVLGRDKAAHFNVVVGPSIGTVDILVDPIDDVGKMIYDGTQAHTIVGDHMPIGRDLYANSVNHPGTKAWGPEIQAIVNEGIVLGLAAGEL